MSVRTRFAPSPTGYLHIGGVRTALFNWLFARGHEGSFVLRIDDTDHSRNVNEALAPILNGLRWLGLDWDEGPDVGGPHEPYYQSQRTAKYEAAVQALLEAGAAYRDFARPEEIQQERDAAQQQKRPFLYSRRWMSESAAQAANWEAEGRSAVVRLKMPREGQLVLHDLVCGDVAFEWSREQDHVVQRADGTCLYHLATVVDDFDMEISHVIRAEEHLSNTPRQVFIAQQLGYQAPQFAHLPYVAEPGSKHKLSKRKLQKYLKHDDFSQLTQHGQAIAEALGNRHDVDAFNPVLVDFYREIGFLPDVLLNYLLLLGWSLDDKTEQFTREEMLRHFSLPGVNRSPASFDPQKLLAFQDRGMRQLPLKQKVARVVPYLQQAGWVSDPPSCETAPYVAQILEAAGDRIKMAGDILEFDDFFVDDEELRYDDQAFQKRIIRPADAVDLLDQFRSDLEGSAAFDSATLEQLMRDFVSQREIKIGQIIHAVRVALTGKAVGFGMFETMAILGRERCLTRIDRCLRRAQAS